MDQGCGKTTVARIVAKLLEDLGLRVKPSQPPAAAPAPAPAAPVQPGWPNYPGYGGGYGSSISQINGVTYINGVRYPPLPGQPFPPGMGPAQPPAAPGAPAAAAAPSNNGFVESSGQKLLSDGTAKFTTALQDVTKQKGIFFIDEIYQLDPQSNSVGKEITNLIMEAAENDRDKLTIIAAGYQKDVQKVTYLRRSTLCHPSYLMILTLHSTLINKVGGLQSRNIIEVSRDRIRRF